MNVEAGYGCSPTLKTYSINTVVHDDTTPAIRCTQSHCIQSQFRVRIVARDAGGLMVCRRLCSTAVTLVEGVHDETVRSMLERFHALVASWIAQTEPVASPVTAVATPSVAAPAPGYVLFCNNSTCVRVLFDGSAKLCGGHIFKT